MLADQVEKYESEQHPLPVVSEADMLRHLIEARGITQLKLATDTGIAESMISNILSGKRGMSRRHIEALAGYLKVSPAVFPSRDGRPHTTDPSRRKGSRSTICLTRTGTAPYEPPPAGRPGGRGNSPGSTPL